MIILFDLCQRYDVNLIHYKNFEDLKNHLIHEIDLEILSDSKSKKLYYNVYISLSDQEIEYLKESKKELENN